MRPYAALFLSLSILAACGQEAPDPGRQKLVDQGTAELQLPEVSLGDSMDLLDSDSSTDFNDWQLFGDMADPLGGTQGLIERSVEGAPGGPELRLSGTSGGTYCLVPAEPNKFYSFHSEVRVQGLETDDEEFFGATPWIAELTRAGTPEEIFAKGAPNYVYHREQFPTGLGTEGWVERSRIFCTGPETHMLLVSLRLGYTETLNAGEVRLRHLKLKQVSQLEYWLARLGWATGVRSAGLGKLDDWRAKRLIRGNLGGEMRPAIVLLPGESLSFQVRLPQGEPHFSAGTGFWDPSLTPMDSFSSSLRVRVEGSSGNTQHTDNHKAHADRSAEVWRPLDLDLRQFAGEEVRLTLSALGDVPGMFGAPQILDRSTPDPRTKVILVSIDTLRADHVGAYGATQAQTPHIDAFAKESLLFTHMVAQAPYTLPGHATILSGQFPGVHGLQKPGQLLSPLRSPVLTRILSQAGYATQAFTGGGFVNAEFGFARDFDGFVNLDPWRDRQSDHFKSLISRVPPPIKRVSRAADQGLYITRKMVDRYGPGGVKSWITEHRDEAFFLFVHTFAIHDYEPPPGYLNCAESGCTSVRKDYSEYKLKKGSNWQGLEISAADREHLKHRYDATLRFTDERFGDLLAHLDSLGIADDTIVVLTTDHGEEMFERGFIQHGKSLYEELTRVPLIIRIPGQAARVIERPAMQVDILPTVLSALGLPIDTRAQGIDLLSADNSERATWSEIKDDFVEIYTYRSSDGWKLIQAPVNRHVNFPIDVEWQLFDLNTDPGEEHNLAEREPEKLALLRKELEALRREHAQTSAGFEQFNVQLSQSTKATLNELGYGGSDDEEDDD